MKMWSIYTMGYFSAIKKNEIELGKIALNEVTQNHTDKLTHMSFLIGVPSCTSLDVYDLE